MSKLSGADEAFRSMIDETANDDAAGDDEGQAMLPMPELRVKDGEMVKRAVGKRGIGAKTKEVIDFLKKTGHTDPLVACSSYISRPVAVLAAELGIKLGEAAKLQLQAIALAAPYWHARRAPENAEGDAMPEFHMYMGDGEGDEKKNFFDFSQSNNGPPLIEGKTEQKQEVSKSNGAELDE